MESTRPLDHAPTRRTHGVCAIVFAGCLLCLGACQDPLFVRDEPRSQYDRTAAIRDRRAPDMLYDEFGARRPNIRGRLLGTE